MYLLIHLLNPTASHIQNTDMHRHSIFRVTRECNSMGIKHNIQFSIQIHTSINCFHTAKFLSNRRMLKTTGWFYDQCDCYSPCSITNTWPLNSTNSHRDPPCPKKSASLASMALLTIQIYI